MTNLFRKNSPSFLFVCFEIVDGIFLFGNDKFEMSSVKIAPNETVLMRGGSLNLQIFLPRAAFSSFKY
jgi:hypothetical protein